MLNVGAVGVGLGVGVGVGLGDGVGVGDGGALGDGVGVEGGVALGDGVGVGADVGLGDGIGLGVALGTGAGTVTSPAPLPVGESVPHADNMAAAATTDWDWGRAIVLAAFSEADSVTNPMPSVSPIKPSFNTGIPRSKFAYRQTVNWHG